ncbi:hypothetical protein LG198_12090 [Methylobacillus arboreus]|uniref:CopD family protein n=1 Tax=Methylobacillus arboreus TaxID=755170 RepID=UPI001E312C51|nr:CopD family protein [Methylobacillus arboreus]MCB5191469.1 hypothetical protein [Methylobacillus arboreus]
MPFLFDHVHLLDGALARAGAYMALAMIGGIGLWELRFRRPLVWEGYFRWSALALGTIALLLALNSAASNGEDYFNAEAMAVAGIGDMAELLIHSAFGRAWLVYWLFLLLAAVNPGQRLGWICALVMLGALVFASHAGELGMMHWVFWIDLVHMACALLWLGGLTLMLVFRLSGSEWISPVEFSFFSSVALPLFAVTLASGLTRAVLQYMEEGGLVLTYAAMLILKLAAVTAVAVCAWFLRRLLQRPGFSMARYDNGLSLEFFFALTLLLFTALLTQLLPG